MSRDFCFDTSNFATIVSRPTFVDKTLLIAKFLESEGQILITAPHRFGKSTNMNMIKRFLEITTEEDRQRKTTDNCKIFENLKIHQNRDFFYTHCGQYPTVYLDFKLFGGDRLSTVVQRFTKVILDTYRQHVYLLKSKKLNESMISDYNKYYMLQYKELTESELIDGVTVLSELLCRHWDKKAVLLIDDYDAPIFDVLFDSETERKNTDIFFRNFMSHLLKNDQYFGRILIHACPRPATLLLTGPSRVVHYEFLKRHGYAEFYGFTEAELEDVARRSNKTVDLGKMKRCCGEYEIKDGAKVYSAWSVVHYLKDDGRKSYRDILDEEYLENMEIERGSKHT